MSKMPCSVTDDPSFDYSDYVEKEGVYKEEDAIHIEWDMQTEDAESIFDQIITALGEKDESDKPK
jgi:hypothetical protein